jgi:hypothetical protein
MSPNLALPLPLLVVEPTQQDRQENTYPHHCSQLARQTLYFLYKEVWSLWGWGHALAMGVGIDVVGVAGVRGSSLGNGGE